MPFSLPDQGAPYLVPRYAYWRPLILFHLLQVMFLELVLRGGLDHQAENGGKDVSAVKTRYR